jgi:hypothetical protein
MDTSNRAGVNSKIYSSFLFAHLLNQAVLGSMALEMSEKEFVFACRTIHRRVTKKLEDKVAPKQNRQPK